MIISILIKLFSQREMPSYPQIKEQPRFKRIGALYKINKTAVDKLFILLEICSTENSKKTIYLMFHLINSIDYCQAYGDSGFNYSNTFQTSCEEIRLHIYFTV